MRVGHNRGENGERNSKAKLMNELILAQRSILEGQKTCKLSKDDHRKHKQAKRQLKQQLA